MICGIVSRSALLASVALCTWSCSDGAMTNNTDAGAVFDSTADSTNRDLGTSDWRADALADAPSDADPSVDFDQAAFDQTPDGSSCGDGICDEADGESCASCPADCACLPTCAAIRYNFAAFTPADFSQDTKVPFGADEHAYTALTWMKNQALTYAAGSTTRQAGYTLQSTDCGATWQRQDEIVLPLKLQGPLDQIGNGVGHFDTDLQASFFGQAFATYLRHDLLRSRIYPLFFANNRWSYQALTNLEEPLPTIGSPSWDVKDNFYSPSVVPIAGSPDKAARLYFGGWRHDYTRAVVADCYRSAILPSGGYSEKLCRCDENRDADWAVDSCTGDKIFVASNAGQTNQLLFRVYQGGGSWSPDGWQAPLFEPIIWPALLNNGGCSSCPLPLVHTNDPSVIQTAHPTLPFVMYFTGGLYDGAEFVAYTHVARSSDGLDWMDFAILRTKAGVTFPAGLTYNNANGTVRAFYDAGLDRILLLSVTTPDHPSIQPTHPDAWKLFLYEIDPQQPDRVLSIRKVDKHSHALAACPSSPAICATAVPYSP